MQFYFWIFLICLNQVDTRRWKGNLKKDQTYYINRDLRNELIGHPIRKLDIPTEEITEKECDSCGKTLTKPKNKSALLSSTFFIFQ